MFDPQKISYGRRVFYVSFEEAQNAPRYYPNREGLWVWACGHDRGSIEFPVFLGGNTPENRRAIHAAYVEAFGKKPLFV